MKPGIQHRSARAAFTLLEVMLAVVILGMVISAIYGTWHACLIGWKHSADVSENFQRERIVTSALMDLSKSMVFAPSENSLYAVNYEQDQANGNSISFVTASDALLPSSEMVAAGMRRVTISLQRDEYGRSFLAIVNSAALQTQDAPPALTHVLSADVCGFAVRFRDPQDGSWKDTWDDPTLMPSALEYTLGFGKNDGRTPPIVVTRAVELPTAQYVMELLGQAPDQTDTTNTVTRQNPTLNSGTSGGTVPEVGN